MKIQYFGHSCFKVEENNYSIVLDPYHNVNGFDDINLKANMVICSHNHGDHNYIEGVEIISRDDCPFKVGTISSYHDNELGKKRGLNNITILNCGNKKIVHLGDQGCDLQDDDIAKIKGCDALMIPVGGYYTISVHEAIKLIEKINPKNIIPMHYKDGNKGLDVLEDIETILEYLSKYKDKLLLVKGYEKTIEI